MFEYAKKSLGEGRGGTLMCTPAYLNILPKACIMRLKMKKNTNEL